MDLSLFKIEDEQTGCSKQSTPSGGFHYLFDVDAEQKDQINSKTTIIYEGSKYNMDDKFKNSLCTCQPSKLKIKGNINGTTPTNFWKFLSFLIIFMN